MIKKFFILAFALLLVSCGTDISGTWKDSNDIVEISFEQDKVNFFGVEGTYKLSGNKIKMILASEEVEFKYKFENDQLTLYLEEAELLLERQE